ncbi:MAG: hypothetical protein AB7O80_06785, partial [Acetobacteraceae bacterium]
ATGISLGKMAGYLVSFWGLSMVERSHPLEGGYMRRKNRTERRPGLPIVPRWRFYPAFAADLLVKHARMATVLARLLLLRQRLKRDPAAKTYRDAALTPDAPTETFARKPARARQSDVVEAG